LTYQYDAKGNIAILNDQVNGITHTYGYDSLDRLDWAKGNNGSIYDHNYDYDRIGNITYKSDVGTYSYTYSNRPHAVNYTTGTLNINLQYDTNGNMVQRVEGGVTTTIGWNYDNKPTSITNGSTTVSFTYDGNGQRVKKTSPSQTVFYFGELYEVRNGVEILQLFAGSRRIASIRLTDGKNQFYHPNHLGSASVITDQNGARKEQIEYHPFGTYRDVGSPTGTYDYDSLFPDVNYTFTDQEDDDEFGFYNYGARLYDPVLGRFISPDSMVPDPGDPQALNRYTYCLNNPLIYTDPSGEFIDWVVFGFFVLFGAFCGASMAAVHNQNIFVGAVVGAFTAAASMGVGYGVGSVVTKALTPSASTAFSATAVSAAKIVGTMAGGFAGGATAGAINAGVYGGNVWQAALYGGLTAAGIAGLVQGAIELNNWANSSPSVVPNSKMKDPKTGRMIELDEPWTAQAAEKILGAPPGQKGSDYAAWQRTGMPPMNTAARGAEATEMFSQLKDLCGLTGHCSTTFDLWAGPPWSQNALKFNNYTLHIEYFSKIPYPLIYHYDIFNLRTDFLSHLWVDVFKYQLYKWGVLVK
jgi:RHS repeat-associated protein